VKHHILCIGILISLSLTAAGCKTAEFGHKIVDVNGMVYDFSNRPVSNYTISLGTRYIAITDINGRFVISETPVGTYQMSGEKDGYELYEGAVDITGQGQIVYIRVPSRGQLLELADEALERNEIDRAETYVERAYRIGPESTEVLFYYATVKFRQKHYDEAITYLWKARENGSKDEYLEKFLFEILRIQAREE
jgi:tetratricopeptide (TPR) repeat protein